MGRLSMSRVVSAKAMRALPVLGRFRVSHSPRNASRIRLVGGRTSALKIFLSGNRVGGKGVSYLGGKDRFVVLDMAQYQRLRECELEVALAEARADVAAGRVVRESPEAHLARLDAMA